MLIKHNMFEKVTKNPPGCFSKSYILIFLIQLNLYFSCHSQYTTYPKVNNFPYGNSSYPSTFHYRSSAGDPNLSGYDRANFQLNGESYKIQTSSSTNNKETHISRGDLPSARDSYSPNGSDGSGAGGNGSSSDSVTMMPDVGGGGNGSSTDSATMMPNVDPTDAPVIGAIDYVLLPLLILGVSGPIFVVMYIVMSAIEFRLPPNIQERSLLESNKHYIDMTSVYQTARPAMNIIYETVSRAIDYGECKEKVACQVGLYAKDFKGYFLYNYFERLLRVVIPRQYTQPLKAYISSVRNEGEVCSKFSCFY